MRALLRPVLSGVLWANAKRKRLAIRLTRWTGKSREDRHPKHLLPDAEGAYWYLPHVARGVRLLDVDCSLGVGRRSAPPGTPLPLVRGDVEDGLPFASRAFDTVLCLDLLEHVHTRNVVLTEIRRVLRPGGTLLLMVPTRGTRWKRALEAAGLVPSMLGMRLVGAIDVLGRLSLAVYRRLSALRRRLAARYPSENAGWCAVCVVR